MNLYLIRHGESIGNTKRGFISGRRDKDGLTPKGKTQIIRAAWDLKDLPITKIYTSPVKRAKETAQILSDLLSAPITDNESFTELDHGLGEGHFWWEIIDQIPKKWRTARHENFNTPYPGGGESFKDVAARTVRGLTELIHLTPKNESIIVVTHQAVLSTILYFARFGDPLIFPQKYLSFVHKKNPSNGGCVRVVINKKAPPFPTETVGSELSLQPDTETIGFYLKGALHKSSCRTIRKIQSVSKNTVFEIVNGEPLVMKLLKESQTLTSVRLAQLYTFLQEKSTVPAPRIKHYDGSGIFYKNAVLVQNFQNGTELTECVTGHPEKLKIFFQALFETLTAIHALPVEKVSDFWFPDDWSEHAHPRWDRYITAEIEKTKKIIPALSLSSGALNHLMEDIFILGAYVSSETYRVVPLHGDLSPQNIVVAHYQRSCRLVRILDFERARLGDVLWDNVYLYGWLERKNTQAADSWREVVWPKLSPAQRALFPRYRTLFHAWSVRDMFDYGADPLRRAIGEASLKILQKED